MKRGLAFLLIFITVFVLSGCGGRPDAAVLFREAKADADRIESCSAAFDNTLVFTANGKKHSFHTSNKIVYHARPFALKSDQTSDLDGVSGGGETYTAEGGGRLWSYYSASGKWMKTDAQGTSTAPEDQIDILRMLDGVGDQKYVRETTCDSQKVHKIELKLQSEVLRSTIESIVTSSGLAKGSDTIVQTLLDSAPDLYGYCYISEDKGQIVRVELDAAEALNTIFGNIDGSDVTVNVSECTISGDLSDIGSAPAVKLPEGASDASSVQAYG